MIDRREGRELFGADPAGYDLARPGHADEVFEILVERCGLRPGAAVLEIGPGTGQATRRLLELGAEPLVAVEPNRALADYLRAHVDGVDVRVAPLEEASQPADAFDLVAAASSFHWVDEEVAPGLLIAALRPGGWIALWWTLFGEPGAKDAFMTAIDPLLDGLPRSPSSGRGTGRPAFALDVESRQGALAGAGFGDIEHELFTWQARWDSSGIRALYGSFSPIRSLGEDRREEILDEIARIAEDDFGGRVSRTLTTSLYTARKPT